jgi:hypothetical protein
MTRSICFILGLSLLALASVGRAVVEAVDFAFAILPKLFSPNAINFAHPGHPQSPLASLRAGLA